MAMLGVKLETTAVCQKKTDKSSINAMFQLLMRILCIAMWVNGLHVASFSSQDSEHNLKYLKADIGCHLFGA